MWIMRVGRQCKINVINPAKKTYIYMYIYRGINGSHPPKTMTASALIQKGKQNRLFTLSKPTENGQPLVWVYQMVITVKTLPRSEKKDSSRMLLFCLRILRGKDGDNMSRQL